MTERKTAINVNFSEYMTLMKIMHSTSWCQVAKDTGLSMNYLYKIVYEHRHANKDYIILICKALGMSSMELGTALYLHGMHLDMSNERDALIERAFAEYLNLFQTNKLLIENGHDPLKYKREMADPEN